MGPARSPADPDRVALRGVTKRFGETVAVDRADLHLRAGEVHAVIGENGAGKTTLMRVLQGLLSPDDGTIEVDGRQRRFRTPRDAFDLGIGMVHQHFTLVNSMTVAENVVLGAAPRRGIAFDRQGAVRAVAELSERYGLATDPAERIRDLSVGEMQRLEILKALYRGARILLLDEPTAVLTPIEADRLLGTVRDLAAGGMTVVFISHKIREVLTVADRITVMRRGRTVDTVGVAAADAPTLARLMIGRELRPPKRAPSQVGSTALEVQDLRVSNDRGLEVVRGVTFDLRRGEIVGIAGVEGNGQSELVEALTGLRRIDTGRVRLFGEDISDADVRTRIARGLAHVPEDRLHRGCSLAGTVAENVQVRFYRRRPFSRGPYLDRRKARSQAHAWLKPYNVRTSSIDAPMSSLSGGSIQKVILARELEDEPRVLIAAQPTRGVDIGAAQAIHQRILTARDQGRAVLVVSAELDELRALADRMLVFYEGAVVAELPPSASDTQLGLAMTGQRVR